MSYSGSFSEVIPLNESFISDSFKHYYGNESSAKSSETGDYYKLENSGECILISEYNALKEEDRPKI